MAALQGAIDVIVKEARREVREDLNPGCDLGAVVRERVEYWGALAEDQGRTVQLELPSAPARVGMGRLDADDVVDILIENVFAHTPEGADFDVSLWLAGHEVHLRVHDRGPGFAARSANRTGSTGLGLEIARRAVVARGGQLLTPAVGEPGASVQIVLPQEEGAPARER